LKIGKVNQEIEQLEKTLENLKEELAELGAFSIGKKKDLRLRISDTEHFLRKKKTEKDDLTEKEEPFKIKSKTTSYFGLQEQLVPLQANLLYEKRRLSDLEKIRDAKK
jgi:hypothetical protein